MPSIYLALSHLAAVGLGAATGFLIARRGKVTHDDTYREGPHMPWRTKEGRRLIYGFGSIVIGLILVGFALQQRSFQAAQEQGRRDDKALVACLQQWGDDVTATLQTRTAATKRLNDAQVQLDQAVRAERGATAAVLITVGGLRQQPPTASLDELDAVLQQFPVIRKRVDRAQARVDRAQAVVDTTQAQNPYEPPRLACSQGDDD
jgi:hypothetical protein